MRIPESLLNRLLVRALQRWPGIIDVRSEVALSPHMRADIIARDDAGALLLFELKARPLRAVDVVQILGYQRVLEEAGHKVYAHLVGDGWPLGLERPEPLVFQDWSYYWRAMA